ncbi:MAG: endo-1,4-beta-xylanase [Ignavibacteria bacterium]|jgi:endo-1,4-beta-xylanase
MDLLIKLSNKTTLKFIILCLALNFSYFYAQPSLKETFKDYYLIGTAMNDYQVFGNDSAAIELIKKQFNAITPENSMKWEKIHPEPGVYNFEPVDSLVAFGEMNNMFIVGHTLVWHSQTPGWVFEDEDGNMLSRDALLKRMKDHIFTVVGRYKGRIHGWDVVNEAVLEDGQLRNSKWLQIIGEDYMQKAFEWAHEADPDAELYYNDFNMWYEGKRDSLVELIKKLLSNGVKIDGIGLQGHWGLDYPPRDELEKALKAYSKLDVKLMITELDMDILPNPSNYTGAEISTNFELRKELNPWPDFLPDSMQTVQSNRYVEYFSLFNRYKDSITRVTFWGVNDRYNWRNNWPVRGRSAYPMLFDKDYKPKPAFDAVIKTVKNEE